MKGISKKQQNIINYINDYKKEKNKMPYMTEIAHHFNKSNSAICGMLKRLKDKGLLEYDNHYNAKIYNSKKSTLERLQQENQQLKIEISAREEEYKKLEDNWNTLKGYIEKTKIKEFEKSFGKRYGKTFTQAEIVICNMIKNKIAKLERGVNDE